MDIKGFFDNEYEEQLELEEYEQHLEELAIQEQ